MLSVGHLTLRSVTDNARFMFVQSGKMAKTRIFWFSINSNGSFL
jgi:hypothetical protein